MEWSEHGIVIGVRRHGENDSILEVLTERRGRHLGLVKGGRSRRLRPILQPGNILSLTWRARLDEHLGNFRAEPVLERSSLVTATRAGAYGLALAAAHLRLLPERDPHPRLHAATAALLDHLDRPEDGAAMMARFELMLLEELGFGLDLQRCASTGSSEALIYVSPRSGRAVSRDSGQPYADRLLRLPAFLTAEAEAPRDARALGDAFRLTGFFLERHVYEARGVAAPDCRAGFIAAVTGLSAPA